MDYAINKQNLTGLLLAVSLMVFLLLVLIPAAPSLMPHGHPGDHLCAAACFLRIQRTARSTQPALSGASRSGRLAVSSSQRASPCTPFS